MDFARRRLTIAAAVLTLSVWSGGAEAQTTTYLPSIKIGTAALITPTAAQTYYNQWDNSHTVGPGAPTQTPPEIVELTRALHGDPDLIYNYVHDNIRVSFMYGLQKGALGAEIDKAGTPFDQAALIVALLQQAGYSASYQIGTIKLTPRQFGVWTGLVNTLNQSAQTFSVDAKAACNFLASGGFPGLVKGTTNCASLSGNLASTDTIEMGHIWVSVTISGINYIFDPSYKPQNLKTGIDLVSATQLVSGDPLKNAMSTMTGGTTSGVTYVNNLNFDHTTPSPSLSQTLTNYGTNLLNYIQSHSLQGAQMEDIVGGGVIIPIAPNSAPIRQTTLPFPIDGSITTWTGTNGIPNQYRTTFEVKGMQDVLSSAPSCPTEVDTQMFEGVLRR